jgi:hypothetical protein
VADRVGAAPHQIQASLARPRRPRRVPLDEGADLAAAVAREGPGCYVLAALRRSRRDRRGGRSRRDRKAGIAPSQPQPPLLVPSAEMTILKRLPSTDLASLAFNGGPASPASSPGLFAGWDHEAKAAHLRELQRQRDWYQMTTAAAADPYPLWAPRSPPCPDCDAAAATMRDPAFHWCVRDQEVVVGFRRPPVGPIERPKKTPSSSPSPSPPPQILSPRRLPPAFAAGLMPSVCY